MMIARRSRWLICSALVGFAQPVAAAALAPPEAGGTVRAVIIGIDDYKHSHIAPRLKGAVADARDVAGVLTRAGATDVTLLLDHQATRHAVVGALNRLVDRAGANDLVIVSFAGHGLRDRERRAGSEPDGLDEYFLLYGFGTRADRAERIVDDQMFSWLKRLARKRAQVIFLADSCFGGGMTKATDPRAGRAGVRSVMRVARPEQAAPGFVYFDPAEWGPEFEARWDSDEGVAGTVSGLTLVAAVDSQTEMPEIVIASEPTPRGAASYAFARALEGEADAAGDRDGKTTRRELMRHLNNRVRVLSGDRQSPVVEPRSIASANEVLFRTPGGATAPSAATAAAAPIAPPAAKGLPTESRTSPAGDTSTTAAPATASAVPAAAPGADVRRHLLYDTQTGDVVTRAGDVVAFGVGESGIPAVVARLRAFERIAGLSAVRPLDVSITPSQKIFRSGERFTLNISGLYGRYLVLANLAGSGELQYLYPADRPAAAMDEDGLAIPVRVRRPFGIDTLIVIAAADRRRQIELEFKLQAGRRDPAALADVLARELSPTDRVGLVTYHSAPASWLPRQ